MTAPLPARPRPTYVPHVRMTMSGRLGGATLERFSYAVNIANRNGSATTINFGTPAGTAWAADTAADAVAFHSRTTSGIHALAVLETVKFASIGVTGLYTTDPYIVDVVDTGGGYTGTPPAAQIALAVSLTTPKRGPRGRGRFYLPMCAFAVNSVYLCYSVADANGARDSAKTFLDAVNNRPGVDFSDVVVVVASTKGTNSPVTLVRVGRVPDTIRSRRSALPEGYGTAAPVV